MLLIGDIGREQ